MNFMGFHSAADLGSSLIRPDDVKVKGVFIIFTTLTTFITQYMWDSPGAIYTLWILLLLDWISGMAKAVYNKVLVSHKLFRMPIYFIVTSILVSLSWWMAKGNVMFRILPSIVLGAFYSVYFISLLENLGELNLLPKKLVYILKSKFGIKTLVEKWTKDEKEKEEEEA